MSVRDMKSEAASLGEELRNHMRKSTTRSSRPVGASLLVVSGVLFLLAYATGSFLAEVSSLAAFVLGAFLLITDFEPRVRLVPSVEAIEGPVKATISLLRDKGWDGKASFVPRGGVVTMKAMSATSSNFPTEMTPYGHDLTQYFESEIGGLEDKGLDFVRTWLPKVLQDTSGLVDTASMKVEKGKVATDLVRPFIRPLCLKPYFTENVCNSLGCPLVNSIGEVLALSAGKTVSHVECRYDPLTQTARAVHSIAES